MRKSIGLPLLTLLASSAAFAESYCVKNIDTVQLFYVNGMFTDEITFRQNINALSDFQTSYLYGYPINDDVTGVQNYSEEFVYQVAEVAFHKLTDEERNGDKGRIVEAALSGELKEYIDYTAAALTWFYTEFYEQVSGLAQETDYRNMKIRLESTLDECARTVLVTHSQGNFYGNRLFTEVSNNYIYPNGVALSEYPMLGYIGIANPTFSYGGPIGVNNPHIAKTFTNSNDAPMAGVRIIFGTIEANPVSASLQFDPSGHGLKDSYLQDNAAPYIADMMSEIIDNLTPYPLFEQHPSSSSAISHIGHSYISNTLDVRFRYGGGYRYEGVDEETWRDFYISTSHGTFFNENIKDRYPYIKIEN
ncbi:KTSC domain-containing protein [Vibrio diabolicus]|uniref:KTSC domain-containing protein n=1 Tax=Vibrio diabolicus TaxID=50719 RepID=UPI00215D47E5|nr:KTSC domain-containing protein [Vibrio diabolicus]ELA7337576.1 KTSC domain-containing protein [Vibrio parahaemolyticus]ELB1513696.1 KTSC domain-containing protein [Vibrio alginolyticus]MCR9306515.1 KTSC domain-containing protein [Vibrio diabolicus]